MIYDIPEEHSNKSGIYLITNVKNGKRYVGSAVKLKKRFKDHLSQLTHGTHGNMHLLRVFQKHGPEIFRFSLYELVEPEKLLTREQFFMDNYLHPTDYNIARIAGSQLGCKRSPETVERMRLAQEKVGAKHYELIDPSGKLIKVFNLSRFSRENGLGGSLSSVISGKLYRAYGYSLPTNNPNYNPPKKVFKLITPDGEHIEVINLNQFIRDNDLPKSTLYDVILGRTIQCHGYTSQQPFRKVTKCKEYELITPLGELVKFNNCSKFAKLNSLNSNSLAKVVRGETHEHKGYTLPKDHPNYKKRKKYHIILPDGVIEIVINVSDFCRKYKLNTGLIMEVIWGNKLEHNGYKLDKFVID